MCGPTQVQPPGERGGGTTGSNATIGVDDGIDRDNVGENSIGLAVNVNEDALGIDDGGEEVLNVNT